MPRYYFPIWDGSKRAPDLEGSELPDLPAAIEEARQAARDIAAEQIRAHQRVDGQKIEVVDDAGKSLATVFVRDVL